MAIPAKIGSLSFKTKKEAKEYFKSMLARYSDGQSVSEEDSGILNGLIERHPEAGQKIGTGITRFFRDRAEQGTSCFWIERNDGSKTEFSYLTCVDAKGKSLYQEFAEACREAVRADLVASKKAYFGQYADNTGRVGCEISGEMIRFDESHLDHKKPMTFQVIVRTFIAANRIEISTDMLSEPADKQFATTFVDDDLKARFIEYHHSVAQLRVIKPGLNLSLGGSERILKSKREVCIVKAGSA
jgi:hypothetical protein